MFFGSGVFAEGGLSPPLSGTGIPAPPIGGVGDAIGVGWEIGGVEPKEGNGDGGLIGVGVGPADNAGGGVTAGAGA
jgi:hypothetical protein